MNNFALTQEEMNRLQFCKEQMVFVSDLCCMTEGGHTITIEGLGSFLNAQIEMLEATIKVAEERYTAQLRLSREAAAAALVQPAAPAIPAELLVRVMEVCSGVNPGDEAIMRIHSDLYETTFVHGHGAPLKAFHEALHRQGLNANVIVGNGVRQTTLTRAAKKKAPQSAKPPKLAARKRERLTATA